jgi:hypothetical protein
MQRFDADLHWGRGPASGRRIGLTAVAAWWARGVHGRAKQPSAPRVACRGAVHDSGSPSLRTHVPDQAPSAVDDSGAVIIEDHKFVHRDPLAGCVGFCYRIRDQRIGEHA